MNVSRFLLCSAVVIGQTGVGISAQAATGHQLVFAIGAPPVVAAQVQSVDAPTPTTWNAYYDRGEDELSHERPAQAEVCFRKAVTLAPPNSADRERCQEKLADTLALRNRTGEAIQLYQQLLNTFTKKYGTNSKQVVSILFSLGSIQEALGDHATAVSYYQRALRINEKKYGSYSPAFANNLQALGRANAKAGKRQEAAKNYKQAMSILMDKPGLDASTQLESIMHDYSDLIQKDDDSDQSLIKDFKQDILNENAPSNKGVPHSLLNKPVWPGGSTAGRALSGATAASTNTNTTATANSTGLPVSQPVAGSAPAPGGIDDLLSKYASVSGNPLGQSLALLPGASGSTQLQLRGATAAGAQSAWQMQSSERLSASQQAQTNEDSRVQLRGFQHPWSEQTLSPAYSVMQDSIVDRNRYSHGEDYYQRMIAVDLNSLGPNHPSVANDLNGLAQFYIEQGEFAKAQPLLKRAHEIYQQTYGLNNVLTIDSLASLARVAFNLGDPAKAEALYKSALQQSEASFGADSLETARVLNELGYLYFQQGKLQESRTIYGYALSSTEASAGKDSPRLAACLKDYAQVLRSLGQADEAQSLESRAAGILDNRSHL